MRGCKGRRLSREKGGARRRRGLRARAGRGVYRAARRACELTNWKNGQYIDTFAAVLAAQGDMAGAVEFQQLALDHAPPTEKYDYEMRLYAYRSHLENRTESPFVSMRAKFRNIDLPAVRR